MIDIKGLVEKGFFDGFSQSISNALMQPNCDSLIQFDTEALESVRRRLQFILQHDTCLSTSDQHDLVYDKNDVILAKPFNPTSFHDGYTSLDHSDKIAKKFRGADASYMEHMKWFPNVYRGTHETFTASSRTFEPVKLNRPQGIIGEHQFGPDQDIDHEAEFSAVVHGTSTDDFTICSGVNLIPSYKTSIPQSLALTAICSAPLECPSRPGFPTKNLIRRPIFFEILSTLLIIEE